MAKIKVTSIPTTKGVSLTLPIALIDKLNNLDISGQGVNISRAVRFILEEYFATTGDGKPFPEIQDEECLIPIEFYADVMNVGKITIRNRAAKGEIKIVSMFNKDFVQCSKDDMINYFAQVQMLRSEVRAIKQKHSEMEAHYETLNELIKDVELLKKNK